jgi:hypothetical protein
MLNIGFICDNENIFLWANACKPVVGLLQERFPGAENVNKLLWKIVSAHGPEAATDASGHDDTVVVTHHGISIG